MNAAGNVAATGTVLGERYRLDEVIGAGGMGEVWRGEDVVLHRTVAVKVLRAQHAGDPDFVERFRTEARHAAGLSHSGIAGVHDYGETATTGGTAAYLVMEYVDGETLASLLAREAPLTAESTLDLIAGAADALEAAHRNGVVHRDVKPGNILVRRADTPGLPAGSVVLTDFGIARATNDPGHLTRTGLVIGTAFYLSPEQASGGEVTGSSDVYSLGVVAYECLAGRRPFEGDNAVQVAVAHVREAPPSLPDSVPPAVARLVEEMLAKDPQQRPPTAAAVARRARDLRTDPTTSGPGAGASGAAGLAGLAGLAAEPDATRVLATDDPDGTTVVIPDAAAGAAAAGEESRRPRWRNDAYPDQRRTRQLFLLIGLVAVVVGAMLLVLVDSGDKDKPLVRPTPTRVSLVASDYVGRPYAEARRTLSRAGLAVERSDTVSEAPAGTVIAIAPTGTVRRGMTVTVSVAIPPPTEEGPPPDKHKPPGKAKGHGEKAGEE